MRLETRSDQSSCTRAASKMTTPTITTDVTSQTATDVPKLLRATAPAGIRTFTNPQKDLKDASKAWVATCMRQLWELEDNEIDEGASPWTADAAAALDHLTATAVYNSAKFASRQPWSLRLSVGHYVRSVATDTPENGNMPDHRVSSRTEKVFACALMHDADDVDLEYGILCIRGESKRESTLLVLNIVEQRRDFASVKLEMHVIPMDVEAKDMTAGPIMAMIEIGKESSSSMAKASKRRVRRITLDTWKLRPSRAASMRTRRTPLGGQSQRFEEPGGGSLRFGSQTDGLAGSSLKHITFIGTSLL